MGRIPPVKFKESNRAKKEAQLQNRLASVRRELDALTVTHSQLQGRESILADSCRILALVASIVVQLKGQENIAHDAAASLEAEMAGLAGSWSSCTGQADFKSLPQLHQVPGGTEQFLLNSIRTQHLLGPSSLSLLQGQPLSLLECSLIAYGTDPLLRHNLSGIMQKQPEMMLKLYEALVEEAGAHIRSLETAPDAQAKAVAASGVACWFLFSLALCVGLYITEPSPRVFQGHFTFDSSHPLSQLAGAAHMERLTDKLGLSKEQLQQIMTALQVFSDLEKPLDKQEAKLLAAIHLLLHQEGAQAPPSAKPLGVKGMLQPGAVLTPSSSSAAAATPATSSAGTAWMDIDSGADAAAAAAVWHQGALDPSVCCRAATQTAATAAAAGPTAGHRACGGFCKLGPGPACTAHRQHSSGSGTVPSAQEAAGTEARQEVSPAAKSNDGWQQQQGGQRAVYDLVYGLFVPGTRPSSITDHLLLEPINSESSAGWNPSSMRSRSSPTDHSWPAEDTCDRTAAADADTAVGAGIGEAGFAEEAAAARGGIAAAGAAEVAAAHVTGVIQGGAAATAVPDHSSGFGVPDAGGMKTMLATAAATAGQEAAADPSVAWARGLDSSKALWDACADFMLSSSRIADHQELQDLLAKLEKVQYKLLWLDACAGFYVAGCLTWEQHVKYVVDSYPHTGSMIPFAKNLIFRNSLQWLRLLEAQYGVERET